MEGGRCNLSTQVSNNREFLFSFFTSVWDFLSRGSFKPAVNYSIDRWGRKGEIYAYGQHRLSLPFDKMYITKRITFPLSIHQGLTQWKVVRDKLENLTLSYNWRRAGFIFEWTWIKLSSFKQNSYLLQWIRQLSLIFTWTSQTKKWQRNKIWPGLSDVGMSEYGARCEWP